MVLCERAQQSLCSVESRKLYSFAYKSPIIYPILHIFITTLCLFGLSMRLRHCELWSCETPIATNNFTLADATLNHGKINEGPLFFFLFLF